MVSRTRPPGRRGEVIYEVYVRSFSDSGGDGVGDLRGLIGRLDHLADLGVDVVWVTPFFPSPMDDFGYDVADYCGVDPLFGSLADAKALIAEAHARGLKVVFDLVASHTSDQHPWFLEARADRTNPKADWYVFVDPKPDGSPPNNWLSVFGGSAWAWEPRRGQYYLHNFLKSQPDLNFHTPAVREAILDAARFWLGLGVDGFRLDVVNYYFHDPKLRSNPPCPPDRRLSVTSRANPYGWQDHRYDNTRPETLGFVEQLRSLADSHGAMLIGELVQDRDGPAHVRAYTRGRRRLHMVYSFDLFGARSTAEIRTRAETIDRAIGNDGWVAWALANHDVPRAVSRLGFEAHADKAGPLLVALLGTLRGSPCLYQGEELALVEADVPFEALQDPYGREFWPAYKGRDGARTPMPWSDGPGAGFTTGRPWLPVDPRHRAANVAAQAADPASPLARVRRFLHWRRGEPALLTGRMVFHDAPDPVLVIERGEGASGLLAAFNLGPEPVDFALPVSRRRRAIPDTGFNGRIADGRVTLSGFDAVFARGVEDIG